jgi:hypothetical protein
MIRLVCLLLLLCALPAYADWNVDATASSLNFVTTKSAQAGSAGVSEVQRFGTLGGGVDTAGTIRFDVTLASVDTGIALRDSRMRERLFGSAALASFRAHIDPLQLSGWTPGRVRELRLDGTLNLNGRDQPCRAFVTVIGLAGGDLLVVTRQPLVLDARAYGLGDGIEALRTLAGLAQLAPTVPVTFTLLLRKQPAAALNAQ